MKRKKKKIIRINRNRRKFLKIVALGGVSLLAVRVFGNKALALASSASAKGANDSFKKGQSTKGPMEVSGGAGASGKDISMVENDRGVVFVDKRTGEEIFILEKD